MGRSSRARPKHLGRKLKQIREELGYSVTHMAKTLGCTHIGYVSGFERNKREPTYEVMVKYAELARCTVDCLVDDRLEIP